MCYNRAAMTNYEKFLVCLLILYFAAHYAVKFGRAARIPASTISLAEKLVTTS